jgi:glutaminyl-peptide cyclotransferase
MREPRNKRPGLPVVSATVLITACVLGLFAFLSGNRSPEQRPPDSPDVQEAVFDINSFSADRAFEEVRQFISLGPRVSGTDGAAQAASYLAGEIRKKGYQPLVDKFTEETPAGAKTFRNIMAIAEGTGKRAIVLISHYDTKAGISDSFTGANDSGSSTGLLLELLRVIKNSAKNRPDIIALFVDGEECFYSYSAHDGLHGSRRFVRVLMQNRRKDRIIAAIVLDMIGDRDLNVTIPRNSTTDLVSAVFEAAEKQGVRERFHLAETAIIDDHVPFLAAGIPAIDIIDFEFGSARGKNDYWHTSLDTLDKLSSESLDIAGRVTLQLLNDLCYRERTAATPPGL